MTWARMYQIQQIANGPSNRGEVSRTSRVPIPPGASAQHRTFVQLASRGGGDCTRVGDLLGSFDGVRFLHPTHIRSADIASITILRPFQKFCQSHIPLCPQDVNDPSLGSARRRQVDSIARREKLPAGPVTARWPLPVRPKSVLVASVPDASALLVRVHENKEEFISREFACTR